MTAAALRAEALFASNLQPSEHPGTRLIQDTVTAVVFHLGEDECAQLVAAEFGDHPEGACRRMEWCRKAVQQAFGA